MAPGRLGYRARMAAHGGQDGSRAVDLDGSGAAPLTAEDPRQIGPYRLLGLLGAGGMGRVYLGVAEGRYAAVKRVLPALAQDPDFLRHFNHELDNLARLPAGVSVPLLETGRTENPPWFATAYIPGLNLNEAVRLHGGPLPSEASWYLLRELAGRLKALHALDMLHRDVKPSNVMITLDGLSLIDFGIARAADQSRLTKTGVVLGTPEYMAPEQAQGKKDLTAAADVFALGSLLFFAATGASPFGKGSGLDVLYRIVHQEPDVDGLRELDPDLAAIVADCLDKSPSARPTAADLLERCAERPELGGAVWPAAVIERLERRAAFAAAVPTLDELDGATVALRPAASSSPASSSSSASSASTGADAAAGAATGQEAAAVGSSPAEAAAAGSSPAEAAAGAGGEAAKSRRTSGEGRRRTRVLPVIVPIVLAAGGISIVSLLPYVSSHTDGKSSDTPSVVLSSASPTTEASASPARSSRSASASASASAHSSGKGTKPGSGSEKSGAGSAVGNGGSSSGGSSGSGGGSGGTSGGSSSGGSSSGGSSSGGSSGGSGGGSGGTAKIGSSGTYRIKDASDGHCLEQDTSSGSPSSYAVNSSCSSTNGSYSEWTFSPGPNGTFKVINKGSGSCLTAFMASGWINMDACGSNSGQYWRIGSTKSSGSTLESTAYAQCMEVAPASSAKVTDCDAANSAQLWSYAGKD